MEKYGTKVSKHSRPQIWRNLTLNFKKNRKCQFFFSQEYKRNSATFLPTMGADFAAKDGFYQEFHDV